MIKRKVGNKRKIRSKGRKGEEGREGGRRGGTKREETLGRQEKRKRKEGRDGGRKAEVEPLILSGDHVTLK